jgi:hypothetical protein
MGYKRRGAEGEGELSRVKSDHSTISGNYAYHIIGRI